MAALTKANFRKTRDTEKAVWSGKIKRSTMATGETISVKDKQSMKREASTNGQTVSFTLATG